MWIDLPTYTYIWCQILYIMDLILLFSLYVCKSQLNAISCNICDLYFRGFNNSGRLLKKCIEVRSSPNSTMVPDRTVQPSINLHGSTWVFSWFSYIFTHNFSYMKIFRLLFFKKSVQRLFKVFVSTYTHAILWFPPPCFMK